jgi:hypothetical protein
MDRDHDALDFLSAILVGLILTACVLVMLFLSSNSDLRPSGCAGLSAAETAACVTEGRL